MLQIGDRVRFLNSVGGGTVQRFIDKDMVSVLEDDGFETPALIKECVVVEGVNENTNFPKKQTPNADTGSQNIPTERGLRVEPAMTEEKTEELFEETSEGEKLTVALAFVPQDVKKIQDTDFDLYLVNDSNYSLYYTISVSERSRTATLNDRATVIENGLIHLNTTLFLREIAKTDLNGYEQLNVQFAAFKETNAYDVKPAVNLTIKLKLVNFYKLHSFTENDYFDEAAMVVPIITQDKLDLPLNITADDFKSPPAPQRGERLTHQNPPPNGNSPLRGAGGQKRPEKVIVDLHIRELLDNTNGLPPISLFEYQMQKFRETLAEHKNHIGQQIVFIHGKGNGVLRKEIIKEIHAKYPAYKYQDASFREYGFGATMITIRQDIRKNREKLPV